MASVTEASRRRGAMTAATMAFTFACGALTQDRSSDTAQGNRTAYGQATETCTAFDLPAIAFPDTQETARLIVGPWPTLRDSGPSGPPAISARENAVAAAPRSRSGSRRAGRIHDGTLRNVDAAEYPRSARDHGPLVDAVAVRGMTVFARIDHGAGVNEAGPPLPPTELLIFGSAMAGTPLMQTAQTLGIDLPLRGLAWQDEIGTTWLGYNDLRRSCLWRDPCCPARRFVS
jgi:uncharacterized protein DUF302